MRCRRGKTNANGQWDVTENGERKMKRLQVYFFMYFVVGLVSILEGVLAIFGFKTSLIYDYVINIAQTKWYDYYCQYDKAEESIWQAKYNPNKR